MSFTPQSLLVPGRIKARLNKIANLDPTPLLVSWTLIMQDDNREKVLAGQDKDGNPLAPVTYRPVEDTEKHIDIRTASSSRLRLGQHHARKRDLLFGGMGPAASGLHNNLTSSEYRRLTGPPLAPRSQFSRAITNLRLGRPPFPHPSEYVWEAFCFWDEVVSTSGFSFLPVHFNGEPLGRNGPSIRRDLRGVRPEGKQRCRAALREWTIDMIRATGV
jgi:hypothetical protein